MRHAFPAAPEQARHATKPGTGFLPAEVVGIEQGWDIAFVLLRAPEGFDATFPTSDHVTLGVLDRGGPFHRMDGRWRGMAGGQGPEAFVLYPGGYDRRWMAPGPTSCRHFYVPRSLLDAMAEETGLGAPVELRDDRVFASDHDLRQMLDEFIRRGLATDLPPLPLEMDTRATLIALRLVAAHSSSPAVPLARVRGLAPARLREVTELIEERIDDDLSLAQLAGAAGLARHHFHRTFREATGVTPHRYVMNRRIARAKTMLDAAAELSEIAQACGFASHQHFATAFPKATGVAPSAWRAARRGATPARDMAPRAVGLSFRNDG